MATADSASGVTNSHAVAVHEYVVGAMAPYLLVKSFLAIHFF